MATYKRRGSKIRKPKLKNNDEYLDDVQFDGESTTQEVFDSLDETASKSEQWLENNQKLVYSILGAFLLGLLLYLAYGKFISGPKEIEAADHLAYSRVIFDKAELGTDANVDSLYNAALNGAENKYGLLDVAKNYSGTKAGNLANYMAGLSYLKINKYKEAIASLDKFTSEDEMFGPIAQGKLGDAFAEIDMPDEAYDYYKKASSMKINSFTTPIYLFKAANTALKIGKFDEALTMFEKIKTSYPKSEEAKSIDIYINRAKYATK